MMTTTKFTNNVLRAKAVAKSSPKFGGKKPAINNYPGQSVTAKKNSLVSGGPGAQKSTPALQTPKGAGY